MLALLRYKHRSIDMNKSQTCIFESMVEEVHLGNSDNLLHRSHCSASVLRTMVQIRRLTCIIKLILTTHTHICIRSD